MRTSPFKKEDPQYSRAINVPLASPTLDTLTLVDSALMGLRQIYYEGSRYANAFEQDDGEVLVRCSVVRYPMR
jgi:DNA polymerase V